MEDNGNLEEMYKAVHKALHCATCKYSEKSLIGKDACCNLPTAPRIQYPKACLDHKEE